MWGWRPYKSAAQKAADAAKAAMKLAKAGQKLLPVALATKKIASTFWGKAWCDNLESYSDFSNRLPRGRSYIRNGSVLDLQISEGKVTALVSGSDLYKIEIKIKPLNTTRWSEVQNACAGKIESLLELLQGRLSSSVMQVVTHRQSGLFPSPAEISLDCSCPDWADMCKHVAAALYGVGARLDEKPELLFLLRGVDPGQLITEATAGDALVGAQTAPALQDSELAEVFGIDLDGGGKPPEQLGNSPAHTAGRKAPSKKKAAKAPRKSGQRSKSKTSAEKKPRKPKDKASS